MADLGSIRSFGATVTVYDENGVGQQMEVGGGYGLDGEVSLQNMGDDRVRMTVQKPEGETSYTMSYQDAREVLSRYPAETTKPLTDQLTIMETAFVKTRPGQFQIPEGTKLESLESVLSGGASAEATHLDHAGQTVTLLDGSTGWVKGAEGSSVTPAATIADVEGRWEDPHRDFRHDVRPDLTPEEIAEITKPIDFSQYVVAPATVTTTAAPAPLGGLGNAPAQTQQPQTISVSPRDIIREMGPRPTAADYATGLINVNGALYQKGSAEAQAAIDALKTDKPAQNSPSSTAAPQQPAQPAAAPAQSAAATALVNKIGGADFAKMDDAQLKTFAEDLHRQVTAGVPADKLQERETAILKDIETLKASGKITADQAGAMTKVFENLDKKEDFASSIVANRQILRLNQDTTDNQFRRKLKPGGLGNFDLSQFGGQFGGIMAMFMALLEAFGIKAGNMNVQTVVRSELREVPAGTTRLDSLKQETGAGAVVVKGKFPEDADVAFRGGHFNPHELMDGKDVVVARANDGTYSMSVMVDDRTSKTFHGIDKLDIPTEMRTSIETKLAAASAAPQQQPGATQEQQLAQDGHLRVQANTAPQ